MACKKTSIRIRLLWCGLLSFLLGNGALYAQTDSSAQVSRHALSYKFALTDYNSLDPVYQASNEGRFFHLEDINYAAELGYQYRIKPSFSLGAALRVGSVDAHHLVYDDADTLCQPCEERRRNELFVGLDVLGQYHFANGYLLPESYWLDPYVLVGIGVAYLDERQSYWDAQIPLGVGLNLHFSPRLAFQVQAEYRWSLAIQKNNLALSAGLYWQLGTPRATE